MKYIFFCTFAPDGDITDSPFPVTVEVEVRHSASERTG